MRTSGPFSDKRSMYYVWCIDEYWSTHPELHDIPIYYASSLAQKCMAGKASLQLKLSFQVVSVCNCATVYQTFIGAMNEKIRRQISISNPFIFKHISNLKVKVLLKLLE